MSFSFIPLTQTFVADLIALPVYTFICGSTGPNPSRSLQPPVARYSSSTSRENAVPDTPLGVEVSAPGASREKSITRRGIVSGARGKALCLAWMRLLVRRTYDQEAR